MPFYEYIDEGSGERVELVQGFDESVECGVVIEHEGRRLRRVLSVDFQLAVKPDLRVTGYAIGNDHPSIDACDLPRDADNNPLFDGQRAIDKFNADSQRQNEKDSNVKAFGWNK